MPELAKVIDTTLFATSIDSDGNLVIGSDDFSNTIDQVLDDNQNKDIKFPIIFLILILIGAIATIVWFFIKFRKEKFN